MSAYEPWEAGEARRDRIAELRYVKAHFGKLFEEEQRVLDALLALGPTPPPRVAGGMWDLDAIHAERERLKAKWEKDQQKRILGGGA